MAQFKSKGHTFQSGPFPPSSGARTLGRKSTNPALLWEDHNALSTEIVYFLDFSKWVNLNSVCWWFKMTTILD
ncbi:hypothetical protein DM860_008398 [Cuscuta australis]|uniref:Uncharacterized protein n=1 Tax=Cuscuta australis TaxID=267555 RepID=A0A328D6C9_9ASTE|nr:hypothetical protein DM860_008398 [Cuscuta australis]